MLGEQLTAERKRRKLSQRAAAENVLHVGLRTLIRWERGEAKPRGRLVVEAVERFLAGEHVIRSAATDAAGDGKRRGEEAHGTATSARDAVAKKLREAREWDGPVLKRKPGGWTTKNEHIDLERPGGK